MTSCRLRDRRRGRGGAVGVGASVLILNVNSVTDAGIAPYAIINAGGGVTVSASMDEHSTPIGFAGGGGFVGVGAQVSVVNDTARRTPISTTTPRSRRPAAV